jgi:tetratricopeptide (TPR) repeat protein
MYAKLYMMSTLACDQFNLSSGFLAPHRYLWYQAAPLEAYYRNGRYITIVAMTDNILEANPDLKVEQIYFWRAMAEVKQGKLADAMKDVQKALEINPNDKIAQNLFHGLQTVK